MKRLTLALVLSLVAPGLRADEPPPWMPAPPPPLTSQGGGQVRRLRREATAFGTIGLVLFGGGIAVNVVALDVPQGERTVRQADGTTEQQHFLADANWAELAGGLALMGAGFALVSIALLKIKQAHRIEAAAQ